MHDCKLQVYLRRVLTRIGHTVSALHLAKALNKAQLAYAASDVLYLHRLWQHLEAMLHREGRFALAQAHFDFLNTRAAMDLSGWADRDLFAHAG